MTFEELRKTTRTPIDCICGGNGVILSTKKPCAEHFLYSTDEEFRLESLRLVYANFRAYVVAQAKALKDTAPHLPKNSKQVDEVVKAIFNPTTPEEWVTAIRNYILSALFYFICD
jgi:hypothetical protein